MFDGFAEYIDWLEFENAEPIADSTIKKRQRILTEFSEWVDEQREVDNADDVSKRDIVAYIQHLIDEGYATATIMESRYSGLSAAYTVLENERIIDDNPFRRITRSKIRKRAKQAMSRDEKKNEIAGKDHLTKSEVYKLAEHVPDPVDRNELLIKLMFWTGIRVSEAVGSRDPESDNVGITIGSDGTLDGPGSDVDPEKPRITVYAPKTDESRPVSYDREEINPLLRDWVRNGRLRFKCAFETDALFVGPKGPLTPSGVERVVKTAADNADMQKTKRESIDGREYKRITPHILRHSHAMYYHNEEDVPLDAIKDHLGHATVDTTEKFYAESTEEKILNTFGQ